MKETKYESGPMVRKQLFFPVDMMAAVQKIAKNTKRPAAEIIRDATQAYIDDHVSLTRKPARKN